MLPCLPSWGAATWNTRVPKCCNLGMSPPLECMSKFTQLSTPSIESSWILTSQDCRWSRDSRNYSANSKSYLWTPDLSITWLPNCDVIFQPRGWQLFHQIQQLLHNHFQYITIFSIWHGPPSSYLHGTKLREKEGIDVTMEEWILHCINSVNSVKIVLVF